MPILPAEPDLYPPDLWEAEARPDPQARWWCLYTKPRQEKATARLLRTRQVPHYLPQVAHEGRTPGGRKTCSILPLFPGYLFLRGDDHQRVEALRGNTLVGILDVADQEGLLRDLRQVHRMLGAGLPVIPEATHPVGSRVRITSGPLEGLIGTVVRRGRRDSFVAIVQFLGRGAAVELQDWKVERLEDVCPGDGPRAS